MLPPLNNLVLYQDDHLLVLNKPAFLSSDTTNKAGEITLVDYLAQEFKIPLDRAGLVHRLDKDTSGVLLVAKTQKALENLQNQFRDRVVKKEYIALVHGEMKDPRVVEGAILRNPGTHDKFIVDPEGRESRTEFIPVKLLVMSPEFMAKTFANLQKKEFKKLATMNYERYTLVSCHPLTGRTHQIRVHLKYINFPILGDEKYCGRKLSKLDALWCPRQFLHAGKITFKHPFTGKWIEVESPLPADLKQVLSNLSV